ncbi:hypothetical protein BDW22DRAFT_800833 [Trametopsis cervina]|nr:hypothetical protein BDW22DRAFT_800833 [Trametopsis cervina]
MSSCSCPLGAPMGIEVSRFFCETGTETWGEEKNENENMRFLLVRVTRPHEDDLARRSTCVRTGGARPSTSSSILAFRASHSVQVIGEHAVSISLPRNARLAPGLSAHRHLSSRTLEPNPNQLRRTGS